MDGWGGVFHHKDVHFTTVRKAWIVFFGFVFIPFSSTHTAMAITACTESITANRLHTSTELGFQGSHFKWLGVCKDVLVWRFETWASSFLYCSSCISWFKCIRWVFFGVFYFFLKLLVSSSPTSLSSSSLCTLFLPHPLPPPTFPDPLRPYPTPPHICSAEASNKYQISKPTVCSVHPGEVLKLSCPLPGTGTITWTKDGSALGNNNRTLIEQEVLQIRDTTPKDSGLYACTSVGKDTVCFIVNVTGESGIRQG